MKHTYLHDVLPFLRELEREKQKQFETYFRTAPLWLMDLFQSEVMEAGITFIRENEPADTIFFVARGRVKATDYRVSGIAYDFMKPMNLIALGGMEVILGQDTYQTTLQTETECIVTKLPRAQYENGSIQIRKPFARKQGLPALPFWRRRDGTGCTCFWKVQTGWLCCLRTGLKNTVKMSSFASMRAVRIWQMRQVSA